MTSTAHNLHSSQREALLEHLFVGELMRHLWLKGVPTLEVLKPQVDSAGYDLVLDCNRVSRHVQLKSSHLGSSTASVKVHTALADKPSGCVIWMYFDPKSLELGPFLWFGRSTCEKLSLKGLRIAKHTKGDSTGKKAARPAIRVLPKGRFERLDTIRDVAKVLFDGTG